MSIKIHGSFQCIIDESELRIVTKAFTSKVYLAIGDETIAVTVLTAKDIIYAIEKAIREIGE